MAILYRALWADDNDALLEDGRAAFVEWLRSKSLELEPVENSLVTSEDEMAEVACQVGENADLSALRIRLSEDKDQANGVERWSTTAHWIRSSDGGWVWVDTERVSDDYYNQPPVVAAPRLVRDLLGLPGAKLGEHPLRSSPATVKSADVDRLIAWLTDPGREVPVIVFSVDPRLQPSEYSERAKRTAARLAGCADVRLLTSESQEAFDDALRPSEMSVFGGGVRVYLPALSLEDPKPWRHRYLPGFQMNADADRTAMRLCGLVLPRMVARRPPMIYRTAVKPLLDSATGEQTDWMQEAFRLDDKNAELEVELEKRLEQLQTAWSEADESESEANKKTVLLEYYRRREREQGRVPEVLEAEIEEGAVPTSCAEAIEIARKLPKLDIPDSALRDIERLDEAPESDLWAKRILKNLKALNAYAEERGPGFKVWCDTSASPFALSSKFIASDESDTVKNSLRATRTFAIDKRVTPAGRIEMFSHTKPVQGGGMQIPRIYYHDDSKGVTGRVHIGFIGPHDLVPNTRTN